MKDDVSTLQTAAHANAVRKGFYEDGEIMLECIRVGATALGRDPRPIQQYAEHALRLAAYMRMVTGVAEAADADRNGNPESKKIPGFSHREEEMADLQIRLWDWTEHDGDDLYGAALAKMAYNANRPRKHNKVS